VGRIDLSGPESGPQRPAIILGMNPEANLNEPPEFTAPLFPLPEVVLLPSAVMPLHIFEPRYRVMTADALAGRRQIAMALLKQGWEPDYFQAPALEPVVCVGRILNCEMLPNGNYNLLLQGELRGRIAEEIRQRPYRMARIRPLEVTAATGDELADCRRRLEEIVRSPGLLGTDIGRHLRKIVLSPLPIGEIADLLAFNFLEDAAAKQAVLADPDEGRRVSAVVAAMEAKWSEKSAAREVNRGEIGLN
jgi:uncharacterized protein